MVVAILGDLRLYSKVIEKQTKYTDLKMGVQKLMQDKANNC